MTRLLRAEGVAVDKRKVSDEDAAMLKVEYETGLTMRELQERHELSHRAVLRALKRQTTS